MRRCGVHLSPEDGGQWRRRKSGCLGLWPCTRACLARAPRTLHARVALRSKAAAYCTGISVAHRVRGHVGACWRATHTGLVIWMRGCVRVQK